jgi:hypothetical protein
VNPADAKGLWRRARRIDGWFSREAGLLFALLDEIQVEAQVAGHLFEIGVHHGKSASFLCGLARAGERVGLCDVFEEQTRNLSGSGSGRRALCSENLKRVNPDFDRVDILAMTSFDLTPGQIASPIRLFHVDGGHFAEEAASDLEFAASVLHPNGAIVLDDPFRIEWPGVTEGVLRFLEKAPEFGVVALGFNKMVLVRHQARPAYCRTITSDRVWDYFSRRVFVSKTVPVAAMNARCFYVPSYRQSERATLRIALLKSLIARWGSGRV